MMTGTVTTAAGSARLKARRRRTTGKVVALITKILLMIALLLPFYLALVYAFKSRDDVSAWRLSLPNPFTLENFRAVIYDNDVFLTGLKNSIIDTIPTVIILMVFVSMTAWVLARFKSKFYIIMYGILSAGLLIPFQCIELPLYLNWYNMGLASTNIGFIIARAGLQVSLTLVPVTSFVKSVPRELEEAATIDGCNRFKAFWKIVFPLMTPINVTQIVLNTLFIWNDYSTAIILLREPESYVLTLAQIQYFNSHSTNVNLAMAFFVLSMIPVLILYLAFQKFIVNGITDGAVKG